MKESVLYHTDSLILISIVGVLMILSTFIGFKIGAHKYEGKTEVPTEGKATILTALFALMGFLLAFTFSMSGERFETRRKNIVNEANAIGTAYLRSDMYIEVEKRAFKADFKKYLDARIEYFEAERDTAKQNLAIYKSNNIEDSLWKRATRLSLIPSNLVASNQMIPALNQMFDLNTIRYMGEITRVPDPIVAMLFLLLITSAFFTGYSRFGKEKIDWIITSGFCMLTVLVVFIILDLDRPNRGMIQLVETHKAIIDLRRLIKEN